MSQIQCPKCNTNYKFISILIRHLKTSSRCKSSEEEIINISNKINNVSINENININKNININENINDDKICNNCKYIFTKKSSLTYHQLNSKCGKLQKAKLIAQTKGLDKLTLEQIKLLEPEKYNNIIKNINIPNNNVVNNTIHNLTNSNNTVNNTINNITNNNTIIQHINPFGFEDVRTIPISEMKMILNSGNEAGIHIIKAIYNKIENKNFYKPNISRSEIACLNQEFKLTIYKSREFCDALFDKCIAFLHHMLFLCKNEYTTINIKYIYDNIEFIESTMRTEIYEKKLQNIIETEFRNNNLDTKDRIKKFIKEIKDNVETKENSLLQIKNTTTLKEDKINEYKISITNLELNNLFGDPKIILGLRKNELMLNLRISRFEESIFYNFWMDRIKNIKKYVMSNKKSTIGDIINLTKEETKIIAMLEIVNKRVEKDRSSDIIDLNINEEFRLADIDTLEEVDDRNRNRLTNTNIINNIDTIVSG
jgi:hypothetical protein